MICRECGARIDDDAVECKFCGALYGNLDEETQPEENVVDEALVQDGEKDEIDELFDENEEKRRVQMEKIRSEKQNQLEEIEKRRKDRKRSKRRNILLIALLVILLGAAVTAGVYYVSPAFDGYDDDDVVIVTQNPTTVPEESEVPVLTPIPDATDEPTEEPVADDTNSVNSAYATPKPAYDAVPQKTAKPSVSTEAASTVKPTTKPKTAKLTSAVITGAEVIKDNGQNYMSFIYNGKWYYAKVSANTTTSSVAWKTMTMTGYSNGETYKGVPVYTVTSLTRNSESTGAATAVSGYILPNSSSVLVTEADLAGKSAYQLRLARNEIYARHGRKFSSSTLQNYFNSCSWYSVNANYNYSNDNANLNSIEQANVKFIKNYEAKVQ